SSRKTSASVQVTFKSGRITEWYPDATSFRGSTIGWKPVEVLPGENLAFPTGSSPDHYYAARATDAAPLRIGKEQEKLIFYRGIADSDVPVRPKFTSSGQIQIRNAGADVLPFAVVYENRGGKAGYRIVRNLKDSAEVAPPELGDPARLWVELPAALVEAGLYP